MPQPTTTELLRFLEIDGWTEATTTRGKSRDHKVFTKRAPDGRMLWTKVSHGRKQIADPRLWHRIWTDQLGLATEDEFWSALKTARAVARPGPEAPPPRPPEWLVANLTRLLHTTEEAARALSPAEAERLWREFLAQPRE